MPLDPVTVAHRWFEEAWNQGSERAIDELSADDMIGHGLGEAGNDAVGRDHFRVFWRNLRTALPDLHVTVEDTITQGEKIAIRIVLEATHLGEGLGVPASNARVKVSGIIIARVVNGQIAEAWNNWDQFALLQQIHAIPAARPADRSSPPKSDRSLNFFLKFADTFIRYFMNVEILIVEDEGLIALDLKKRLEQAGYKVVAVADNGEDAILNAGNLKPDLILMDIRLRGPMDGVEIADEIRKRFYIPVIFVTAHADRETLDRARITEPFGYIVKPFHGIDFRVQIEVALWRHKMEQKLRVSQAWLSATFQNVADGLIATDEAGNVALMNKPASLLTGWDSDEAQGLPLDDVFRLNDETTGRPVANAAAPGFHTFILSPRGDFDPPIIEAEISENRDEGKTFGVIIAFRDITERRKAERRDRQVQKMNALTLMATGLGRELAESQSRMDESIKFLIENTQGETARLLWDVYEHSLQQQTIVQQLITLGRTDAGRAVPLDLNAILAGLREPIRKALGVHRNATFHLRSGTPLILADPALLRENILRLITDCRHATAKGAAIEISTMPHKSGAQLVIRDDRKVGEATRERVFDPYYQSSPGKRNPGFTLALVCQFVALAGGTIEVETIENEGSAYIIRFPAATGILAPPEIGESELVAASATGY